MHDASRVSGRKIRASALEAYSLELGALEMTSKAKGFASLNDSGEWNSVTDGFYWILGLAFARGPHVTMATRRQTVEKIEAEAVYRSVFQVSIPC